MKTENEVLERVKEIQREYYNMINEKAALYILAMELGINVKEEREKVRIADLGPRMKNVSIEGVVEKKFPPRKVKDDMEVQTFILSDEEEKIRVVIWSKTLINTLSRIPEGSRVRIMGGYTREGKNGLELHLGSDAKIILIKKGVGVRKVYIKDGKPGIKGYIIGTVRKVFPTKEFSGGKVNSFIIDDGTGVIRCVIFGEEKVRKENEWEEFLLVGRFKENSVTGNLEFIVENVWKFDPKKELERRIF